MQRPSFLLQEAQPTLGFCTASISGIINTYLYS